MQKKKQSYCSELFPKGKDLICYDVAMILLKRSRHKNQMERRKAKYPNHFDDVLGVEHITLEYYNALKKSNEALAEMQKLKTNQ